MENYNQKHLTPEERRKIEESIEKRLCKSEIAKLINKHPSTIAKEIKKNRRIKSRNTFNYSLNCKYLKSCKICTARCSNYEELDCKQRDRFVGACNNCPNIKNCKLDKYFYNSNFANDNYLYTLKDAREGVNLTYSQLNNIAHTISPLINTNLDPQLQEVNYSPFIIH